jgi:hypothetical protein
VSSKQERKAKTKAIFAVLDERRWKAALVAAGIDPRPYQVERERTGSTFDYDAELLSVVEQTSDGHRFLVTVEDGEIRRVTSASRS